MSEKRQESPGGVGDALAMKSFVQQCLTGIRRTFQEARIVNPLLLGSSPCSEVPTQVSQVK
jgi:hypothetical protein